MQLLLFILQLLPATFAVQNCAIHEAILSNQLQELNQMIQNGCDLNQPDQASQTPLMLAIQKRNSAAANLLLDHPSKLELDKKDQHGIAAISRAAMGNLMPVLEKLITLGADLNTRDLDGSTPVFFAVLYKNQSVLELLIQEHAELDHRGMFGQTPLTFAIAMGSRQQLFQLLIDGGASLDATNSEGLTPIMLAVDHYEADLVQILINKKTDLNTQDSRGDTPLMKAIYNSDQKMVKLLFENGANPEVRNFSGDTALTYATSMGMGETEIAKYLILAGVDVNAENNQGNTALIHSVSDEATENIKLLLAHGANLEHKNKLGENALMQSVNVLDEDLLKLLIDSGARLDERNLKGKSALMLAAKNNNNEECVHLLLSAGALPFVSQENSFQWDIDLELYTRLHTFNSYLSKMHENHLILALKNGLFHSCLQDDQFDRNEFKSARSSWNFSTDVNGES
jgi:ankyrin repeat protein